MVKKRGRERMKALCPICNRMGFVEERKHTIRFKHYVKYENGRRVYTVHSIPKSSMHVLGINGNQNAGIKTLNLGFNQEMLRGRRLAWSRLRDLGSRDPGSNPGDPTKGEHAKVFFILYRKNSIYRCVHFCTYMYISARPFINYFSRVKKKGFRALRLIT